MSSFRMDFRYLKPSLGACLVGNIHAMWVAGMTARVALPVVVACLASGRSHTINVAVGLAADSRV